MSAKPRVKVIKKVIGGNPSAPAAGLGLPDDLGSTLNESLFDRDLAFAKFIKMIRIVNQYVEMLQVVRDAKMFPQIEQQHSQFIATQSDLAKFTRASCMSLLGVAELPATESCPTLASIIAADPTKESRFQNIYEAMRESPCIKLIIQVCDRLVPYKAHIEHDNALDGHFLITMPGVSFMPFADFDVKDAYLQNDGAPRVREFILVYLNKLYNYGYRLYQEYTSPDMNVEQMVSVVHNAIEQLRREPRLSRCSLAFDMIEKSISMLKDNFGNYYTDFLQSRSSTIIFENFVIDVAKNSKAKKRSAVLAHQFNQIIGFYREASQKSGSNKQAEALFARFAEFNSRLEVRNLGAVSRGASGGADAPSASASASTSTSASASTSTKPDH